MSLSPTSMAALSVAGHGGMEELLKHGFRVDLLPDADARTVFDVLLSLPPEQRNIANVLTRARLSNLQEVARAWRDGYGSGASECVRTLKDEYLKQHVLAIQYEFDGLMSSRPAEIQNWLPMITAKLQGVMSTDTKSGGLPSSYADEPIAELSGRFSVHGLNDILRGGYWSHTIAGFVALSGGGKTSMTATIASLATLGGVRNTIVTNEMTPGYHLYRALRASWAMEEPMYQDRNTYNSLRKAPTEEHKWRVNWITEHGLRIFGSEHMTMPAIERHIMEYKPAILQIDHLLAIQNTDKRTSGNSSLDLGALIYALQRLTNKYGTMIIVYGQLSNADAELFKKNHDLPMAKFFGSALVNQALRFAALMSKDFVRENTQFVRVKKSSLTENDKEDTIHKLAYDSVRAVYADMA